MSFTTMSNILDFKVDKGLVISSSSSDFEVQALLGSGSFGEVAECRKVATGETVAIKVLKNKDRIDEAKHEVVILTMLRRLHCEKFNIVTWNNSFYFKGRFCIEFEKLDINLFELLLKSGSLDLLEIRPIVQQLATALEFLGSAGIIHTDLKPENIMLVDHEHQPLKIKVIDFGMATYKPAACTGLTIQTLWFRSPEVLLGAPISEAIDVWSLGCIAAELLMGKALFPGSDKYDTLRHIILALEKPPDHLLSAGLHSTEFFTVSHTEEGRPIWSFIEPGNRFCYRRSVHSLRDLMEIKMSGVFTDDDVIAAELDLAAFVDLVRKMLKMDAAERITPSQILQHPFITMSHLRGTFDHVFHVILSKGLMGLPMEYYTGDGGDSDQEAVTSNNTSGLEDNSETETDHSTEPSSFCRPITHDSDTQNSPGRKRKRSSDGDSEGGHRSSNNPPASKRSAVTGLPGRDCSKAPEESSRSTPGLSSSLKRGREDSTAEQTTAKRPKMD